MFKSWWPVSLVFWLLAADFSSQPVPVTPLLLTEIYYDTPGKDADQEWIEMANLGSEAIDLSDHKLSDEESTGGREGAWLFPTGATIEAGQVIIVAQQAAGFRYLFGRNPDYEFRDSDPTVPDMRLYPLRAEGDLMLANDGDELLLLDGGDVILDAVNYGDASTYFQPAVQGVLTGQSIERIPAHCDSDTAADWLPQPRPTPGQLVYTGECRLPPNPAERQPLMAIGQIQGTGPVSPYINQQVNFRGVVTGAYEDRNTRGITFYLLFVQDVPGYEDGDPATSDGIAVFLGREKPGFQPGDQVNVSGLVTEFFGSTEIDSSGLVLYREVAGMELPAPIPIDPPAENQAQAAYLEPLEGMLVALDGAAQVVGPSHVGCGFEVVSWTPEPQRVMRQALADPVGDIMPVLHDSDVDCGGFPQVKSGDRISGIRGPLLYSFDQFKISQQAADVLEVFDGPWLDLPVVTGPESEQLTIATFNLGDHFDATDDTGDGAEPVPQAAAVAAKQQKLVYAIEQHLHCPTLLAIQEIENIALLQKLAAAAGAACGLTYEVSHRESPDARGIDLALLTDSRQVRVREIHLRQVCTGLDTGIVDEGIDCGAGSAPLFSRPPLEVGLEIAGQPYMVLVNHFKSKRGGELETAPQRLEQARYIHTWVNRRLAGDEAASIVVLGDFNDYELSPAMRLMTGGQVHLTQSLAQLPDQERYSYIFGGASQLLDGILLSPQLADRLAWATILHVNADYPDGMALDTTATGLPYRSSDHDIPLIALQAAAANETIIIPTVTVPVNAEGSPEARSTAQADRRGLTTTFVWLIILAAATAAGLILIAGRARRFRDKKI